MKVVKRLYAGVVLPTAVLDPVARDILGSSTSGVGTDSQGSKICLLVDSASVDAKAQAIFDGWDGLTVTADKTTMTEGDTDPVITCNDAQIASDTTVGYVVLLDGVEYASGDDTVTAGVATLTLASPVAGVYDVYIFRKEGNYSSGKVTINVNEA